MPSSQRNLASISYAVPVNDVSSAEHHFLFRWSAASRHKLPLALPWTLTGACLARNPHELPPRSTRTDPPCRSRPESHELPRQYTAGELAWCFHESREHAPELSVPSHTPISLPNYAARSQRIFQAKLCCGHGAKYGAKGEAAEATVILFRRSGCNIRWHSCT
jgi:hypothetical protein